MVKNVLAIIKLGYVRSGQLPFLGSILIEDCAFR